MRSIVRNNGKRRVSLGAFGRRRGGSLFEDSSPALPHGEVFLTSRAPYQPLRSWTLWPVVARRLRGLESSCLITAALLAACVRDALLSRGLSLKEIGDHLDTRTRKRLALRQSDLVQLRKWARWICKVWYEIASIGRSVYRLPALSG